MNKPKLAIVGIVGVPATYGGFETLVDNLLDLLPQYFDVTVFCEDSSYDQKLQTYKNAKLEYVKLNANGFQSIIYDGLSLLKSFNKSDVLLVLGVSGAVFLPIIRPFFKGKIVTNIDGLEWKRDKWKSYARKFLKLSERLSVKLSDTIIADNKYIQDYVSAEYNVNAKLIAYGGDHAAYQKPSGFEKTYPFITGKYFFTVCRVEPENNIKSLIKAFLESNSSIPYVIVGNWEASEYGKRLFNKYNGRKNLILSPPVYEPQELGAIRSNCYFYVHGHSAGGTNPSLVEAMYLGLPIMAYDVCYNRATTFDKAVYFKDHEELVAIFKDFEQEGEVANSREDVARNMKDLALQHYTWAAINESYKDCLLANIHL